MPASPQLAMQSHARNPVLKVADQQTPKIYARSEAGSSRRRVKGSASLLSKKIEAVFVQNYIQAFVKRVTRKPGQCAGFNPHRRLVMLCSTPAQRHTTIVS